MKRRDFIKRSAFVSASLSLPYWLKSEQKQSPSLVVQVEGESPYAITQKAISELGGMGKFVSKGDIVMIKPNIGWNRTVEQGANTNPEVLKAVIESVLNAGAKRAIVMDNSCHKAEYTYARSGIAEMAKKTGAEVRYADDNRLTLHDFKGEKIKKWPIYKDFLEVDKFINLPILKHHGSAGLTIGMKNLFGITGGNRGKLHTNMGMSIADLAHGFKTHLTLVDAYRIMLRNGPIGGRESDIELKKTIIASANILEADVTAIHLFGANPTEFDFINNAFGKKMGQIDLAQINLKKLKI